ncbi:MAG: hypothetical protein PHE68_02385 [Candidatus Peribacteraceae bacterium]|nr:hypothetical protein [Candidatus Peribacteraceae bacterium]
MQVNVIPAHHQIPAMIEAIHNAPDWKMIHDRHATVRIPLVVHRQFVMIAEDEPGIVLPVESPKGDKKDHPSASTDEGDKKVTPPAKIIFTVDRPWIVWLEGSGEHGPELIATLSAAPHHPS